MENQKIVIIGGVAGGASAAARLRRLSETAQITMVERGPDVSFANCGLPYHIGGEIEDRSRLAVQTPESLKAMLNLNVQTRTQATAIRVADKIVRIKNLDTNEESDLPYDKLILAPGASPLRPPLPGIDDERILSLRNLQDMDKIKERAKAAKRVLVIGAGFIGLEMAEQLVLLNKTVAIAEMAEQVMPVMDEEMTRTIADELESNGVELMLGDAIASFESKNDALCAKLKSGREVETDLVILSIGVKPDAELAKEAGLEIGARGHIIVNEFQQTSDENIYAAGDAVQTADFVTGEPTAVPLGGPANRQGRIIADHIVHPEKAKPYAGSLGTAIVRVFDSVAGSTGWTEKKLKAANKAYHKTIVTDFQHASYFPGAQHVTLKICWGPESGKLLGAQAYGVDGVDKRIDILATAIHGGMTIADLTELELAYAPPFGSAKDVVNIAGYAAMNIDNGVSEPIYELPKKGDAQIIDVRPKEAAEVSPIAGAINIPLTELRERLSEIDQAKPVVTVCNLGKMSYFAARVLKPNGFKAMSLIGGNNLLKKSAPAEPKAPDNEEVTPPQGEVIRLDATGIACPGPIMRVKGGVEDLQPGQILEVTASDAGFASDIKAFCAANDLALLEVGKEKGIVTARIQKSTTIGATASTAGMKKNGATLVVFSQDLDKALASMVIANGAAAMGGKVTLFFTFWGLNVLRKDNPPSDQTKSFMDKLFGWMMPRGVNKLPLSKMHFFGAGTWMMKDRMKSRSLPNLPDLLQQAQDAGVRMVACSMSMEAMGIRQDELIDGIEIGGVADYLGAANETPTNLFI